tara:strand:+ start:7680 stop:7988 length:309 start_codon:yes stop_codon:yes gene_type:complete
VGIIRSFFFWVVIIIAAIFAVGNRTSIIVELWPLPFVLETQVGLAVLLSVSIGIIIGMLFKKTSKIIKKYPRDDQLLKNTAENLSQDPSFSVLRKTERANKV